MKGLTPVLAAVAALGGLFVPYAARAAEGAQVAVIGQHLVRDGRPWTPHGFFQIAFATPPGSFDLPGANPVFAAAYKSYSPSEYDFMREAGADSVRMNGARVGSNPSGVRSGAL